METLANRASLGGKRLLVLGGNTIGAELRHYAERYGVTLITAGNDASAAVHQYSDEQYYFDVSDRAALHRFVKEKHIDGILSFTSEPLLDKTIQNVVDTGLPYHYSQARWDSLMDKCQFKKKAMQHGIKVLPPISIDEAMALTDNGQRVVVKPTRAGASLGITVCDKAEQLAQAIALAKKYSYDGNWFIERFLEGDYFQFEIWCAAGQRYMAYSKDRVNYPPEPGCARQPFCDLYPSTRHAIYYDAFFAPLCSLFDEIELIDGSVQFQGIIEKGTPYIMDVAYRLSGGVDFKVPNRDKGVDLIAGQMDYALTGEWIEPLEPLSTDLSKVYLTLSPGIRNGKIARIEGVEKVKALDFVYDYMQYFHEGDVNDKLGTFLQTFCRIFIEGSSREDLYAKAPTAMRLLTVYDESGQEMLLKSPAL